MPVVIYHNPKCAKSRETLQLLRDRGIEPEIIEYLKNPPSRSQLAGLLKLLGLKARDLLRTREPEYRKYKLDDPKLPDRAIVEVMANHPRLIERPIVVKGRKAALGRPPENVIRILK